MVSRTAKYYHTHPEARKKKAEYDKKFNEKKEQREKQLKEEQARAAEKAARRRNCPFSDGMQTDCKREACALFMDGCTLARLTPAKDTEGLQCPFSRYRHKCRKDCALYKGGCTLTGINQNIESEDK